MGETFTRKFHQEAAPLTAKLNEAIHYFEVMEEHDEHSSDVTDFIRMAVAALKKRKASPVDESQMGDTGICPSCKRFVNKHERSHGNNIIPYCKWCGQHLGWDEAERERIREYEREEFPYDPQKKKECEAEAYKEFYKDER